MSFAEIVSAFRTFDLFTQQRLIETLTEELALPIFEDDPLAPEEEAELGALADAARLELGESIVFTPSEAALKAARAAIALQR